MGNELTYWENILLCNEKDEKANRHCLFKTATCKDYVHKKYGGSWSKHSDIP